MTDVMIVTGGAGFIGCNFVRRALARTVARVVVLDKLTYAGHRENLADVARDPRFSFVQGDICDRATLKALFESLRPTSVVNLAAETHVDRSIAAPHPFVETNVVGTFELLEASRVHFASLGDAERGQFRFLHVSSDEVYGSCDGLDAAASFSETSAYAPSSPYAATKAGADHLVQAYRATFGLPTLITNCTNNYGPYQHPEKLIPLMITSALEGKSLPLYGDGGNVRDWIYVEDHCAAVLEVLERGRVGERYNIGSGAERTNVAIVDAICASLEEIAPARESAALASRGVRSYSELKTFVADRLGHDRRYALDTSKIRGELSWKPEHDLASGLSQTVRWYVAHREWCAGVSAARQ
jgi:dTDP-glucose 4,6-dehydratase